MGIHLVFFLHVTTGPDNTNNVLALAFGLLIVSLVVVGTLRIMADLNYNMMPACWMAWTGSCNDATPEELSLERIASQGHRC